MSLLEESAARVKALGERIQARVVYADSGQQAAVVQRFLRLYGTSHPHAEMMQVALRKLERGTPADIQAAREILSDAARGVKKDIAAMERAIKDLSY